MSTPLARKLLNEHKKQQPSKVATPITKRRPANRIAQPITEPIPEPKTFSESIKEKEVYKYPVVIHIGQLYRVFGTNELFSDTNPLSHYFSATTGKNSTTIKKALAYVGGDDGVCTENYFEKMVRSHVAGNSGKRPDNSPFLSTSDSLFCDYMQGLGSFLDSNYNYVHLLEIDKAVLGKRVVNASLHCSSSDQGRLLNRAKGAGEFLIIGDIPAESISNIYTFKKTENGNQPKIFGSFNFRTIQTAEEQLDEKRRKFAKEQVSQAKFILENQRRSGK